MANLDVDLQGTLNKLLTHECTRIKATRGEGIESVLERLKKADLMPEQVCTRVANNLASLLEYEKDEVVPTETRKNGRGWSAEYIEKAHMEYTIKLIHDMCNVIDKEE